MTRLHGVCAILVTPFGDDERLDLPGLTRVAEYTIELGVHGVGIGLASEYMSLSDAECVEVARTLVAAAHGRVPVVMSCGRPSTSATIDLARAIAGCGVDALMVLPPYVMAPDLAAVEAHYRTVAQAIEIPLIVQDAPTLSGVTMPPDLLVRLVQTEASIRYLKIEALPSAPKIAEVARLLAGRAQGSEALIGGAGGLHLLDELRGGAHATMPGCAYADLFVHIWDRFRAGDTPGARRALHRALPLLLHGNQSFAAFVGTQKEMLHRAGVIASARLRAPTEQIDAAFYSEVPALLEEARGTA